MPCERMGCIWIFYLITTDIPCIISPTDQTYPITEYRKFSHSFYLTKKYIAYELKQICAYIHATEFILTFFNYIVQIRPLVGPKGKKRGRCKV